MKNRVSPILSYGFVNLSRTGRELGPLTRILDYLYVSDKCLTARCLKTGKKQVKMSSTRIMHQREMCSHDDDIVLESCFSLSLLTRNFKISHYIMSPFVWRLSHSSITVILLLRRYAPAGNTSTVAETGTTSHAATSGCSRVCQVISQALERATGSNHPTL